MITRWQYYLSAAMITTWHYCKQYCISAEMVIGWRWGTTERERDIWTERERKGREDAVLYEKGG